MPCSTLIFWIREKLREELNDVQSDVFSLQQKLERAALKMVLEQRHDETQSSDTVTVGACCF